MPRIVSFSWTSPALLAGFKTCTRREWDSRYARGFRAGDLVLAYDRSPRSHGEHVATIRLLQDASYEPLASMPDSDYQAEGFEWLLAHPGRLPKTIEKTPRDHFIRDVLSREGFERWRHSGGFMWVIRFELVSVVENGVERSLVTQEVS